MQDSLSGRAAELAHLTDLIRTSLSTDGKVGPPGRSPKGLFRLVHNCE
jgi:hypothetical protein